MKDFYSKLFFEAIKNAFSGFKVINGISSISLKCNLTVTPSKKHYLYYLLE